MPSSFTSAMAELPTLPKAMARLSRPQVLAGLSFRRWSLAALTRPLRLPATMALSPPPTVALTHLYRLSFRDYGESVLRHLENAISKDPNLRKAPVNHEGVRVSGYGGWFLLRLSLHDPVLPLNIEVVLFTSSLNPNEGISESCDVRMLQAQSNDDAIKLGLAVLAAVNEFPALDVTALNKFVHQ
ncbi:phosphoglucosamine mutase family protein [Zea mays]|uniref:Phosphoglucosamine mutase family protein n=1 Tax=Zea mays TaxID=4577 RepID=A0A1D6HYS3_MAIZE|nr:phosphoglucosamine mutase family protein [Zea mays]